jgi:DUF1680 family protein
VTLQDVHVRDGFWGRLTTLARDVIIPYQWAVMNDRVKGVPPSGVVRNFKIVAGKAKGDFTGFRFQDSDLGKWLEAVAYSLTSHPDAQLERTADRVIDLVAEAQAEDGYLDTYYQIGGIDQRWTNVRDDHEMYVAGHMLEGAVAYFEATGKRKFLDVMIRTIEHIADRFGPRRGQQRGYPGHQEIELALVKLYRLEGEQRYLDLASFFIDERAAKPSFYDREKKARKETAHWTDALGMEYFQAHAPVREQKKAVGHAVRAMYMYCGMADVAAETGDKTLVKSLKTLWRNTVDRRMYVTGAIGSTDNGEAFTHDYDLPNETSYAETCASIGLIFWAQRMLRLDVDGEYTDVLERALYNGTLTGVSLDGKHFFYANPLASQPNPAKPGEKLRPGWHGCACCPPNLARLITSLGSYIYGQSKQTLFVHLFADSDASFTVGNGTVTLKQKTQYPWDETVSIQVNPDAPRRFRLAIRIPAWCRKPALKVNGKRIALGGVRKGYAVIDRSWAPGDRFELVLPMPAERVYMSTAVKANVGRVALQRGPVVYCLEQADNGEQLDAIELPRDAALTVKKGRIGDVPVQLIHANAVRLSTPAPVGISNQPPATKNVRLVAVPYHLWANRGEGEMHVWMRERQQ